MRQKHKTNINIKTVSGPLDFSSILHLIKSEWPPEAGEKSDALIIEEMKKSYDSRTDTVKYLIQNDDEVIGFYRYSLWPRQNPNTKMIHLLDIAIDSGFQNKGWGSFLMGDLIKECREKKCTTILSRTFKSNKKSIALHKKFGFEKDVEKEDSIVWKLLL